jgi:hypothetical protein
LDSYEIFQTQLSDVLQYYPNLIVKTNDNKQYIKGILDIPNSKGNIVNSYLIEIRWKKMFPYRFPELYEFGTIPCGDDWHKYEDNSCCITVEPEEIITCKNGITVLSFIRRQVIPYLANQSYKLITGVYKDEFPHGIEGYRMFYAELMKTADSRKWIQYADFAFNGMAGKLERNKPCFCGSGVKYKRCHDKVFEKIRLIGKESVKQHFILLINKENL